MYESCIIQITQLGKCKIYIELMVKPLPIKLLNSSLLISLSFNWETKLLLFIKDNPAKKTHWKTIIFINPAKKTHWKTIMNKYS